MIKIASAFADGDVREPRNAGPQKVMIAAVS